MTDRQFMERMIFLTEKLSDLYNSEPLDQVAHQACIDEVDELGQRFNRSHRRDGWFVIFALCVLLCLFVWIIYTILW